MCVFCLFVDEREREREREENGKERQKIMRQGKSKLLLLKILLKEMLLRAKNLQKAAITFRSRRALNA